MQAQLRHDRNCPAVWRGFHVTLFDRVPEDAPCTCGAEARAAARAQVVSEAVSRQAA